MPILTIIFVTIIFSRSANPALPLRADLNRAPGGGGHTGAIKAYDRPVAKLGLGTAFKTMDKNKEACACMECRLKVSLLCRGRH